MKKYPPYLDKAEKLCYNARRKKGEENAFERDANRDVSQM